MHRTPVHLWNEKWAEVGGFLQLRVRAVVSSLFSLLLTHSVLL
jgi:hypothetical protein